MRAKPVVEAALLIVGLFTMCPLLTLAQNAPICDALQSGDLATVHTLLKEDASSIKTVTCQYGYTVLHQVVSKAPRHDLVQLLISSGADVNATSNDGFTPLHLISNSGPRDIVELLIANGADVNARILQGIAPLHRAVAAPNLEIVELLISKGADVNARDRNGVSVLHAASTWQAEQQLQKLLGKAPNPNAQQEARRIAELLLSKGAKNNADINQAPVTSLTWSPTPDAAKRRFAEIEAKAYGTQSWILTIESPQAAAKVFAGAQVLGMTPVTLTVMRFAAYRSSRGRPARAVFFALPVVRVATGYYCELRVEAEGFLPKGITPYTGAALRNTRQDARASGIDIAGGYIYDLALGKGIVMRGWLDFGDDPDAIFVGDDQRTTVMVSLDRK